MELLESIAPTASKDIIGNKLNIKSFIEILKTPTHSPKIIGLIGPIGCGKSLICSLVFKELDMKVIEINDKVGLQNMNKLIVNKTIECYVEKTKRRIILIDNLDILMSTERSTMSLIDACIPNLIRTNTFIVITSRPSEEKSILTSLKKNIDIIKLNYAPIKDVFIYLTTALPDEDEERLLTIVKKQRGNIRDIVLNIKQSSAELDIVVQERGFSEYNNFEIIDTFFLNQSWEDVLAMTRSDPSMVSYLAYENILDDIYNNREANAVMKSYVDINRYFVQASMMEKYMQESLDWSIYNIIQLIKIGGMYVIIKPLKRKASRKNTAFRFSQVLSKLSHRNIMAKKLSSSSIPNIDLINLIDGNVLSYVKGADEIKQANSTYHKYFV